VADAVLAGEQTDHRPRRLRCGAGAAAAPCAILVRKRALAPSAVFVLPGFEPRDGALDPGLVDVDADLAQPRERREGSVDIVDTPAAPPPASARLVLLQPIARAPGDRMIGAIPDARHHLEHATGEVGAGRISDRLDVGERKVVEPSRIVIDVE